MTTKTKTTPATAKKRKTRRTVSERAREYDRREERAVLAMESIARSAERIAHALGERVSVLVRLEAGSELPSLTFPPPSSPPPPPRAA